MREHEQGWAPKLEPTAGKTARRAPAKEPAPAAKTAANKTARKPAAKKPAAKRASTKKP